MKKFFSIIITSAFIFNVSMQMLPSEVLCELLSHPCGQDKSCPMKHKGKNHHKDMGEDNHNHEGNNHGNGSYVKCGMTKDVPDTINLFKDALFVYSTDIFNIRENESSYVSEDKSLYKGLNINPPEIPPERV